MLEQFKVSNLDTYENGYLTLMIVGASKTSVTLNLLIFMVFWAYFKCEVQKEWSGLKLRKLRCKGW